MADHTIKFTAPSVELGSQDVTFEVFIDGKKIGQLQVSEGGLDWWPRSSKKRVHTKSWTALRDFMEG